MSIAISLHEEILGTVCPAQGIGLVDRAGLDTRTIAGCSERIGPRWPGMTWSCPFAPDHAASESSPEGLGELVEPIAKVPLGNLAVRRRDTCA